ncbi:LacI family transcriptional regulator [Xaviernesmea oryzae]|uniref:LacI family transcriptional regulator n=1 Tax=Xaviernesmea oryzae TaxID=464029 RepID=A0A1Q9B1P4_9HYPH|nr:substrate-binding domain-containing protein [Xaviernesmea oryzae]OLP61910.1 LacI family transcriptional regulator [Xaviernesmea oryzae]
MKGIRALARHLDISIGTVSRALNGKPDVNPETRARVMEAARALGYTPNQSGRSLRQGVTNTIGFMIEMSPDANASGDDFFMGVFEGVQTVLNRHRLDLVVFPCPAEENPVDYLSRLVGRGMVDAMIISATRRRDDRIDFLEKTQLPFIALGRSESGPDMRWIDLDFEGVAHSSVARLVAKGHRRIALAIPDGDINLGHVFHDAYRAALSQHGIAYNPALLFRVARVLECGDDLVTALLALPELPSAILLSSEVMSLSLYRKLQERGIRPGRDIAVIGFRDNPRTSFLTPSLTCHSISLSDLGQTLAETLLAGIPAFADLYPGRDRNLIWPMALVQGESDDFDIVPER